MQTALPTAPALSGWPTPGPGADLPSVALPPCPGLRALLAVADPADLPARGLPPVDLSGEVERVRAALDDIPTTVLPAPCSGERATLGAIAAALRHELAICWLVCQSQIVRGEPCLWLEQPDGAGAPVPAGLLAAQLARSARGPLLVVLASYADAAPEPEDGALMALGMHLAQGGIPAVLALRGPLAEPPVEALMAAFFCELGRDGRVAPALAAARRAVPECPAPALPALFLRHNEGYREGLPSL